MMIGRAPLRRWTGRLARSGLLAAAVALTALLSASARAGDVPADGSLETLLRAFPDGMTPEQLDAVVAVMDDGEVRAALRGRLLADLRARTGGAAAASPEEGTLEFYVHRLDRVVATYPTLPVALAAAFARPRGQDPPIRPLAFAASILAILAAGAAAMLLARRVLADARGRGATAPPVRRVAAAALFDAAEVAAFVAGLLAAYVVLRQGHPAGPPVVLAVLRGAVVALVTEKAARLLLSPDAPGSRPISLGDAPARVLHRAVTATVLLAVAATVAARILAALGLPGDAVAALVLPLSLLPFTYLALLAWRHREGVAEAVAARLRLGAREAPLLAAWPALATAYLLALWIVVTWGVLTGQPDVAPKALASLLLLLALPPGAWLVQRPLARFYDVSEAHLDAETEPQPAMADEHGDALPAAVTAPAAAEGRRHVRRLMRAAWVVLLTLTIVLTTWIWGFDPERHAGVSGLAVRLLFDVGVVLLLGYVAWALIVRSINGRLEAARREQGSARAQRVATLLPLLRKFLQVVLVTTIAMVLLSSLGVDIGPLIAGAGVVGLAIGLGAQQTIADILAGVFFLIEDAFHLGDYVEVGNLRGTVEGISLRSLKLRHHRGAVHTLPFGQIKSLTNHTRDWALMRLEFRVAPETDTALVKRIVKGIAKELQADPEIGAGFIEPLKSQGIRNVEDGAVVIGVKYITKPGAQFVIRREAYRRILAAFREHAIELVGRGVVVKVEGPAGPHAEALGAAAAAAEAARHAEAGAA